MLSEKKFKDILVAMKEDEIKEIDLDERFYLWVEKNDNGDGTLGWCIEIHDRVYKDDTFCESVGIYDIEELDYDYLIKFVKSEKNYFIERDRYLERSKYINKTYKKEINLDDLGIIKWALWSLEDKYEHKLPIHLVTVFQEVSNIREIKMLIIASELISDRFYMEDLIDLCIKILKKYE